MTIDNTTYPYISSDVEISRLDHHHTKVWLPLTGQLAPTYILSQLKDLPSPRVADIATGTGSWISSIAEHLSPEAELWGFDIDVAKIPQSANIPSNVSFQQHDALLPFPEAMQGTFDLVHVRLLVLGLRIDEWDVAIRNAIALLKPGGWLFWEELPQGSVRMIPPSKPFEEWWRAHMLYGAKIGRDPVAPYRLRNKFARAGLEDCDEKVWSTWSSEKVLQSDTSTVLLRSIRPIMTAVVEGGGLETVQGMADITRLEVAIMEELQSGSQLGFDFLWAVGRQKIQG